MAAAQFLDVAVSTSSTALTIPTSTDGEAATADEFQPSVSTHEVRACAHAAIERNQR